MSVYEKRHDDSATIARSPALNTELGLSDFAFNEEAERALDTAAKAARNSSLDGVIDETLLMPKYPALFMAKNSLREGLWESDCDDQEELIRLTRRNEMAYIALGTTTLMFARGLGAMINKLDPISIDSYVYEALDITVEPPLKQEAVEQIKQQAPLFHSFFDTFIETSYKAVDGFMVSEREELPQEEQNTLASVFQRSALSLYLSLAGALGLTDKIEPEELAPIDWHTEIIPGYDTLYDMATRNSDTGVRLSDARTPTHNPQFDPHEFFEDSPGALKLYESLIHMHDVDLFYSDEYTEDPLLTDRSDRKIFETYFKDYCFGAINMLHSSNNPNIVRALKLMDEAIIKKVTRGAYERAKILTWSLDEDDEPEKDLIDDYPLLKGIRVMAERSGIVQPGLQCNVTTQDKVRQRAMYHSTMAVLLTLAAYVEQTAPAG